MKSSRFSVEQIIQILAEAKLPGQTIAELCRRYGISRSTFDKWRAKYEGMSAEEAKRLKALEAENSMLKRLLAEKELELTFTRDLLKKK